ncbi:MAG: site-specific DNA-methyltransferase [Flavobacteriales bacterium]|nr:site-specific DNA-methyltransferase [Flavobacteriales bacterium]
MNTLNEYSIISSIIAKNQKTKYFNPERGVFLIEDDCLKFMDELIEQFPDGIFDMIFSDPPYFLSNGGITCNSGKMVKVDKGTWDKSQGIENNHSFNINWLSKCQRLLKKNGTIWVSGTHHVIFSVGFAMQQLGMKILNTITWEKPNPPPNLSCRYFTHSTETILWASKNKYSKHIFNYELLKDLNFGKQMKDVWRITAPSNEEKIFGKHPTQKPVKLLERIIISSTQENALIFDPFSGSGTTGVAAIRLNRNFIGCELESSFIKIAIQRLQQEIIENSQMLNFEWNEKTR